MDSSNIKVSGGFSDSNSSFITVASNKSNKESNGIEVDVHSSNHSDANSSITSVSSEYTVDSNIKAAQNSVAKEVVDDSKDSLPVTISNEANAQNLFSMPTSLNLEDAFRDDLASNNLRISTAVSSNNKFQQEVKVTEFDNRQKQISSPTSANCRMPNTQRLDADIENKEELKNSNVPTPEELEYGNYFLRVIPNEGQKEYICRPIPDHEMFDLTLKSVIPNGSSSTSQQQQPYGSGSSKTNNKIRKHRDRILRHTFTEEEKRHLEEYYAEGRYLTIEDAEGIGDFLNMSYETVLIWFKNRRVKDKQKN